MASEVNGQQGAASGPSLLSLKRISKLTDAAQELFITLVALERTEKTAAKARVARALDGLDLIGLTCNRLDSEAREYRPGTDDPDRWP